MSTGWIISPIRKQARTQIKKMQQTSMAGANNAPAMFYNKFPIGKFLREGRMDNKEKNPYILEMKDICKKFGSLQANNGINLKVRKGTVHAVIGENGAGKSTLMNILTRVYKMDSGEILIDGRKMNFHTPKDAVKAGVGMVYQEFMLYRGLTVLENVILGDEQTKFGILSKKRCRSDVQGLCEKYHFDLPLSQKIDDLPVAVLQQIEIVKVLYREAEIIILDEPTSVLTPQGIQGLFQAIHFLTEKGKTIIFITHKLQEVLEIADDITVLKDGCVTGTMPNKNVTEHELASMMVGREVLFSVKRTVNSPGREILSVKNLTVKDADGIVRLENASFSVREGEILGIAGIAGSGQKELAEAVVGLSSPEKGASLLLDGEDMATLSVGDRRKHGLGYIPQDRNKEGVSLNSSIWENAVMGYHLQHGIRHRFLMDFPKIYKYTDRVIEEYSVKVQSKNDPVQTLSGGNIQKLIVGREFLQDKKLLVIEDPTRGIDIGSIEFIWQKIIDISRQGTAILLISHELNEIRQLSDRILVAFNKRLLCPENSIDLSEEELGLLMTGGMHSAE